MLVVSESLKFDAILGSFLAGAFLAAVTAPARDEELGHVRHKLEGIGFGFFVPIFFVVLGARIDLRQGQRRRVPCDAALFELNWLSASGSACFIAAILAAFVLRVSPRKFVQTYVATFKQLSKAMVTIAARAVVALRAVHRLRGPERVRGAS